MESDPDAIRRLADDLERYRAMPVRDYPLERAIGVELRAIAQRLIMVVGPDGE